jgi:hypothetical protein
MQRSRVFELEGSKTRRGRDFEQKVAKDAKGRLLNGACVLVGRHCCAAAAAL